MPAAPPTGGAAAEAVTAFAPGLPDLTAAPPRPARREVPVDLPAPAGSRFTDLFEDEPPAPLPPSEPDAHRQTSAPEVPEPRAELVAELGAEDEAVPTDAEPLAAPVWVSVARGVAGVLAVPAFAAAVGRAPAFAAGWCDLAPLPAAAGAPVFAFCGTGLVLFAVRGPLPAPARWGATLSAAVLGGLAVKATALGWRAGGVGPSLPAHLTLCLLVVLAATRWRPAGPVRGGTFAALAGALACGLSFPLAAGALAEVPQADRTPAVAVRAVAGWWTEYARPVTTPPRAP